MLQISPSLATSAPVRLPTRRTLRLPAYWVHCEQHVLGDVAAAREVWESTLKGGLGRWAGPGA